MWWEILNRKLVLLEMLHVAVNSALHPPVWCSALPWNHSVQVFILSFGIKLIRLVRVCDTRLFKSSLHPKGTLGCWYMNQWESEQHSSVSFGCRLHFCWLRNVWIKKLYALYHLIISRFKHPTQHTGVFKFKQLLYAPLLKRVRCMLFCSFFAGSSDRLCLEAELTRIWLLTIVPLIPTKLVVVMFLPEQVYILVVSD